MDALPSHVDCELIADEEVIAPADVERLLEERLFDRINIKISRVGGLHRAFTLHGLTREHGMRCQLGCELGESSLLTAAGRIFACITGDLTDCEGSFGGLILDRDVIDDPLQFNDDFEGLLDPVAGASGLGVEIDDLRLETLAAASGGETVAG